MVASTLFSPNLGICVISSLLQLQSKSPNIFSIKTIVSMGVHESNRGLCAALVRKFLKLGCIYTDASHPSPNPDNPKSSLCADVLSRIVARGCDTKELRAVAAKGTDSITKLGSIQSLGL